MQTNTANTSSENDQAVRSVPKPVVNEAGSINVSGYIRIFDPNTTETLVEARE